MSSLVVKNGLNNSPGFLVHTDSIVHGLHDDRLAVAPHIHSKADLSDLRTSVTFCAARIQGIRTDVHQRHADQPPIATHRRQLIGDIATNPHTSLAARLLDGLAEILDGKSVTSRLSVHSLAYFSMFDERSPIVDIPRRPSRFPPSPFPVALRDAKARQVRPPTSVFNMF
jgi:hypothetical protein